MSQSETADRRAQAGARSFWRRFPCGALSRRHRYPTQRVRDASGNRTDIERVRRFDYSRPLAARWDQLAFSDGVATGLQSEFAEPIREFWWAIYRCHHRWLGKHPAWQDDWRCSGRHIRRVIQRYHPSGVARQAPVRVRRHKRANGPTLSNAKSAYGRLQRW